MNFFQSTLVTNNLGGKGGEGASFAPAAGEAQEIYYANIGSYNGG